jgi:hypothetical protein
MVDAVAVDAFSGTARGEGGFIVSGADGYVHVTKFSSYLIPTILHVPTFPNQLCLQHYPLGTFDLDVNNMTGSVSTGIGDLKN